MNHLVRFNEEVNIFKESYIHFLCQKYRIKNYIIAKDGYVNILGGINLAEFRFNKIPIRFGRITSHFYCRHCGLKSLENSPRRIDGNFSASFNFITSLEGFPQHVGMDINLIYNPIKNVKGFPEFFEYTDDSTFILSDTAPIVEILSLFKIKNNDFGNTKSLVRIFNMLNEYDVIQGDNVILDRLEMSLDQLGIEVPNNIELKNYKLI